ncbi:integrase catalytic domain-containing protein [Nephila pilipes]|uniref:Integrase catalytic domain-containing protein n=1 Tax=Nephila pilipes TaxID=299642 RepID=A0A8X6Q6T1_NEPPI|nr:integrase catalytic domain-containing protein [Nephila pilipes]
MTNLREEFWVLKYLKTLRKVISKCVICKRFGSPPVETPAGKLTVDLIRATSVFEIIRVDFAGPFSLKENKKFLLTMSYVTVKESLMGDLLLT